MERNKLKNKVARGSRMLDMNGETYELRRSVMGVIYRAKKVAELPRVEVRIVEAPACLLGYAYGGRNIIHISRSVVVGGGAMLDATVLHEILHAVKDADHDPRCPLMAAHLETYDEAVYWDAFKRYF